jgi:hypothetical protein
LCELSQDRITGTDTAVVDVRMFKARIAKQSIIPDGMVYCENGRIDRE